MKTKDLRANPSNPRVITDAKLKQLDRSMEEFGDISGVCFNRRTGNLFGGHQRNKNFDETSEVNLTKNFEKPTKKGTVAVGYILHKGERFSYREVDWPEAKEKAAMLAANKNAGEWDTGKLTEELAELSDDFADLSMFDEDERFALIGEDFDAATDENNETENTSKELEVTGFSRLTHECPKCGFTFNSQGSVKS